MSDGRTGQLHAAHLRQPCPRFAIDEACQVFERRCAKAGDLILYDTTIPEGDVLLLLSTSGELFNRLLNPPGPRGNPGKDRTPEEH